MHQGQSIGWDWLVHVVKSTAIVDERFGVDLVHRPYVDRTAGVVHPDEPINLELVSAQEDSGHLRAGAASDARAGRHEVPVQASPRDRLAIEAGRDMKRAHPKKVLNAGRPEREPSTSAAARVNVVSMAGELEETAAAQDAEHAPREQ